MHKYICIIQSIHIKWSGTPGHVILNMQYIKTELSYDLIFCTWVGIHKNSKLIQLFLAD